MIHDEEVKLKRLSNQLDFFIIQIMNYEKLPYKENDEELIEDIINHLKRQITKNLKQYQFELKRDILII